VPPSDAGNCDPRAFAQWLPNGSCHGCACAAGVCRQVAALLNSGRTPAAPPDTVTSGSFVLEDGIHVSRHKPSHRDHEYDPAGFDTLVKMQREHFLYKGRHALVQMVLRAQLAKAGGLSQSRHAVDLGAGCGGWIEYVNRFAPGLFGELALADSSVKALQFAYQAVGPAVQRYQIDLLCLDWEQRSDVVFLLDVLEHVPDHIAVLQQVRKGLRLGGLLVMTVPAFHRFWTYNDTLAGHQRRYERGDLHELSRLSSLSLMHSQYFMFLLSPALLISRWWSQPNTAATPSELQAWMAKTHKTPPAVVNKGLEGYFGWKTGWPTGCGGPGVLRC
jgi:SAM-dependent methyltransferase